MLGTKKIRFARRAFMFVLLAAAIGGTAVAAPMGNLDLTLKSGSDWSHVKKFGIAKVTLLPQFAVWLEREDGTFAGDLLVTRKSAKSAWGNVRRPEALPVWSHARGVRYEDGLYMPTKRDPLSDAVTGATPKPKEAGTELRFDLPLPAGLKDGRYRILVEVNNSFDYNEVYAEGLPGGDPRANGVNGQPSVVYAANLTLGSAAGVNEVIPLNYIGTGHPAGSDGAIRPERDGLTSALTIVDALAVRVR